MNRSVRSSCSPHMYKICPMEATLVSRFRVRAAIKELRPRIKVMSIMKFRLGLALVARRRLPMLDRTAMVAPNLFNARNLYWLHDLASIQAPRQSRGVVSDPRSEATGSFV